MVSASSVQGAPRPVHEPWLWRRSKPRENRIFAGLLLAAGLHAGVLALAVVAPKSHLAERFWVPVEATVDVDIDAIPAAAAPALHRPEIRASEVAAGTLPDAPFVRANEPRARPDRTLPPLPSVPVDPTSPGPPATPEYDGPPPPLPVSESGLSLLLVVPDPATIAGADVTGSPAKAASNGGSSGAVEGRARSPEPAKTAPKRALDRTIATRLLAGSLSERDEALGLTLPAAGNVASALHSAVRTALGPASGSATFLAILTPSGQLLGITPVATNGASEEAWMSAARTATASLAGRTFSMVAPFRNGAVVWVDVTSSFVLPSGAAAPVSGEPGGFRFDLGDLGRRKQQVIHTKVRVTAVK